MKSNMKSWLFLPLVLLSGYGSASTTQVEILSAVVKDAKIPDAQLMLQRNGESAIKATTNAQGQAVLESALPDTSDTLLIVKKSGYSNLVVKCPCNGMSYALSPVLNGLDSMRVVLTWGAQPEDLDSHIVYPGNHIYFDHQEGDNGNLDVDDTDSFGPETITLTARQNGQSYVYAIHDFTDRERPGTTRLSESQAKVFVYVGESLVRTYYVPQHQTGNLWTVFKITPSGDFVDINKIEGVTTDSASIGTLLSPALADAWTASHNAGWSQQDMSASRNFNLLGETAYQQNDYDQAIAQFTAAVNAWADNGKAYGNLGLVYQKAGRTAEALWANRKALALASGTGAPTVRAGANYNIGKIYETAGDYQQALRYYQAARNEKANTVYDNAITRVQGLIH
ncbi:tetratricopeptide repeat protein [Kosakonia sp. ML.JS2a]|uniref:tetratricopeptide repeat protein n=1 Tax=Kosakonia sp. ML.JS2a TaxID=2980557 RepID=UPI0021D89C0D|nr:tetratricopeptide repeat protein [Kosakonia sp. ML.JS2a]UXY08751.1 tetratricopeptide repeat protein [Kosakonia sp. ML.JS2a]